MATARGIRAGLAYIELGLKDNQFTKGLNQVQKRMKSIGKSFAVAGAALTGFAASAAAAFIPAIRAASDFNEAANRFGAIFGDLSDEARDFADSLSDTLGRSLTEVLEGMASFQSQAVGVGFDPRSALQMSKALTELAYDFASLNNLSDEDAIHRFISAMSGEAAAVDFFGISIKEAALNLKLLELGFPKAAAGATEAQKALARFSIIQETLGRQGAIGDALRTSGEFAGQMKRLGAAVENAKRAIGDALLPTVTSIGRVFTNVIKSITDWVKDNQDLVKSLAATFAIIGALGSSLIAVGLSFTVIGIAVKGLITAFSLVAGAVGIVVGAFTALFSPLGLVVSLVAVIGYNFRKELFGAGGVVDYLTGKVGDLVSQFEEGIGIIGRALARGDIATAADVLWAGLQVIWAQGIAKLNEVWDGWKAFFVGIFIDATAAAATTFVQVLSSIKEAWIQTWDFIKDSFFIVTGAISQGFLGLANAILGLLGKIAEAFDYVLGTQISQNIDAAQKKLQAFSDAIGEQVIKGVGERDVARQDRLRQLEEDKRNVVAILEQERVRKQAALAGRDQSAIEDAQKRLEAARENYARSIQEASSAQTAAAESVETAAPDLVDQIAKGLGDVNRSTGRGAGATSVFGGDRAGQIFGSIAGEQLAVSKQQLEEAKKQTDETKKTRAALETGGLGAFA